MAGKMGDKPKRGMEVVVLETATAAAACLAFCRNTNFRLSDGLSVCLSASAYSTGINTRGIEHIQGIYGNGTEIRFPVNRNEKKQCE